MPCRITRRTVALAYAQQKYRPRCLIDVGRLTEAALVALGRPAARSFSNDEKLQTALLETGGRLYDRLWPLPLRDDGLTLMKGGKADLRNSGGRAAHAICRAIFPRPFVDPRVPWSHLNTATVTDIETDDPYGQQGATGFGGRMLIDGPAHRPRPAERTEETREFRG